MNKKGLSATSLSPLATSAVVTILTVSYWQDFFGFRDKIVKENEVLHQIGTAGYKLVQRLINTTNSRGWFVYQRSTDEINANKNLYAK